LTKTERLAAKIAADRWWEFCRHHESMADLYKRLYAVDACPSTPEHEIPT